MTWRVLVSCPNMLRVIDDYREPLRERGVEIDAPEIDQQLNEEDLLTNIHRYDGIIAGDDELTRPVLERAKRLRVISKWGVGTDNIDREAAREHDIVVINTPGVFGSEVADVAVGYLVMLARQLHHIDARVRAREWYKPVGTSLAGKVLGIVGLGSIGGALIARALAMSMRPVGVDPSEAAREEAVARGAEVAPLDQIVRGADFLVLCCPLTPATKRLLDKERLAQVVPGTRIVNVSRGQLIDEDALVEALRTGQVGGAALDVFEREPLPDDSALRGFDNVILGSHNAANTEEAVRRVNDLAIENLLQELERPQP